MFSGLAAGGHCLGVCRNAVGSLILLINNCVGSSRLVCCNPIVGVLLCGLLFMFIILSILVSDWNTFLFRRGLPLSFGLTEMVLNTFSLGN